MEVEDAILELLQPLRETPGAKTLAAFQGQPDKDTWARLRRGFPAVLVLYAGSPAFMPSGRRLEERMEFEVYVMDKSYRSAQTAKSRNRGTPEPMRCLPRPGNGSSACRPFRAWGRACRPLFKGSFWMEPASTA